MSNLEASYNFILNKLIEISGTENFYFKLVKP
ncbi:IS982 family transposase, partial [Ornithobacterium rhinotracheale]